jgi:predicted TPR repeat methyltransferase
MPPENIGYRWTSQFSVEPSEVEAEFDAEAAEYERQLTDWDYRVPEDSTKLLTQYVPRSAKVLEAGCGTGLVGAAHYVLGYQNLYGCDLSSAMLGLAKSKGIYKQLLHADLCQRLPYEDDDFDATTCLATLSFIEDAELTLREFCRVTRPEGVIIFSHRRDLFESRNCLALCQQLEKAGLWKRELHSDWNTYIPGHPAYTDKVRVGYFVYRVKKPDPCSTS